MIDDLYLFLTKLYDYLFVFANNKSVNSAMDILFFIFVVLCSFLIYHRTNKLYKLSEYKGLRIFSLSFLFFSITYLVVYLPYFIDILFLRNYMSLNFFMYYYLIFVFLSFFFLSLASLFLVYSLMWKDFEKSKLLTLIRNSKLKNNFIKKNSDYIIINIYAIAFAFLGLFKNLYFVIIMLVILIYAGIQSYSHYKKIRLENRKNTFAQFYFFAIVLAFMGYFGNFLLNFFPYIEVYVEMMIITIFIIFLFGTYRFYS